ncbi:SPOR domain-containing protein [Halopseudomonas phragmitis]|uniref:SPOR domain-containing protein n=2 Tax=Pseudomonadaceae TaxID=135621 RepID=A0A1V0B7L3_9GAMM|nr:MULTISPECIES: SPOR domain-containing protein [Pseudomonadaceae]AQZ95922.1 hypothetical protein BVH74_14690 [Halopseudomonas phragmitis]PAU88864.1 cell division protein [Pseudomonas sp. WN033]RHW21108.1 cell division protein [Pseudomonas jilinensis]
MDEGLKQRIIGALVLIIAAVVFLPMLLSGQDETVRVEVEVPEPPVLDSRPIEVAAPIELPEPAEVAEIPEPGADLPTELPPVAPAPEPAPAVTAAPEPPVSAPAAPAPAAPVTVTGDWVIQLGSFSNAANAESFRQTLRSEGYNAYTLTVQVDGRSITRVYVGPLVERAAANSLRDELARKHGNQGLVVAYDANTRAR